MKSFESFKTYKEAKRINEVGLFGGYEQAKGKVIIPLGLPALDSDTKEPLLTVATGLQLNKTRKFPHNYFDLRFIDGKIFLVLTKDGKTNVKVNSKNDPGYLQTLIKDVKSAVQKTGAYKNKK